MNRQAFSNPHTAAVQHSECCDSTKKAKRATDPVGTRKLTAAPDPVDARELPAALGHVGTRELEAAKVDTPSAKP